MSYFLVLSTVIILIIIARQDFKYRTVEIWTFPALFFLLFSLNIQRIQFSLILKYLTINVLYTSIVLSLSFLLLLIRRKRINIFQLIGLGDLLFIICVCIYFCPLFYFLLFVISNLTILIFHNLICSKETIPLAGYQSAALALLIPYLEFFKPNYCGELF